MRLGPHRVWPAPDEAAKRACALDVLSWGYPRSIPLEEVQLGFWVRYGPDAVFWYTWNVDDSAGEMLVHLCVAPQKRGAIYPRKWTYAVELFAEWFGARRLVYLGGVGDHPVEDYLVRLGWERHGEGLARELPPFGGDDGLQGEEGPGPGRQP